MKKNKDMISIDQLFADKFNEGKIDLDPHAAWQQFEDIDSYNKVWSLKYIGSILPVILVILIGCFILELKLFEQNSLTTNDQYPATNINYKINIDDPNNAEAIIDAEELGNNKSSSFMNFDYQQILEPKQKNSVIKESISIIDETSSNTNAFKRNILIKNTSSNSTELVQLEVNKSDVTKSFASTISLTKNNNSSVENQEGEDQSKHYNSISLLLPKQEYTSIEKIPLSRTTLKSDYKSHSSMEYEVIKPLPNSINNNGWHFDIGFSIGNKYELTDDHKLNTQGKQIYLSNLTIGRKHLFTKRLKSQLQLSYCSIKNKEEFSGIRIHRTYSDKFLSGGYSINYQIFGLLEAEINGGIGISLIDKIEFEQKPFWVGGNKEYKDYTKTIFNMNPTMAYQVAFKLMFNLPYKVQLFGGTTYRSQFANQLRSKQTNRENTLTKFTDIQLVLGLRYNI